MMDEFFDELEKLWKKRLRIFPEFFEEEYLPLARRFFRSFPVEISESEDEVIVRANLPGFKKDEIEVFVEEDSIEIIANKKEHRKEREERIIFSERLLNYSRRVLQLPTKVKPETAKAKFSDGILEVRIEKLERGRKGKRVEIE